jgi:hypothetical protein
MNQSQAAHQTHTHTHTHTHTQDANRSCYGFLWRRCKIMCCCLPFDTLKPPILSRRNPSLDDISMFSVDWRICAVLVCCTNGLGKCQNFYVLAQKRIICLYTLASQHATVRLQFGLKTWHIFLYLSSQCAYKGVQCQLCICSVQTKGCTMAF